MGILFRQVARRTKFVRVSLHAGNLRKNAKRGGGQGSPKDFAGFFLGGKGRPIQSFLWSVLLPFFPPAFLMVCPGYLSRRGLGGLANYGWLVQATSPSLSPRLTQADRN